MVLATEMDNIILPGGKSPNPNIMNTPSGDYISLNELRRVYLPEFSRINSNELTDGSGRGLLIIPGSLFIVSHIGTEQYIVQLSKPAYSSSTNTGNSEIYISIADIVTVLTASNILEFIELGDKLVLQTKKINSNTPIPEFAITSGETEGLSANELSEEINPDNSIAEGIVIIEDSNDNEVENYVPSGIVNNSVFPKYNKHNSSPYSNNEELDYSILPTAIAVINNTREAFKALKPSSQKVIYLEPELLKSIAPKNTIKHEAKQDESLPPNLFTVPKGLFRRGIDRQ